MSILNAVRSAHAAGLCLLPTRADGSRAPSVPSWTEYQQTRPTVEQMRRWGFEFRDGFGMLAGPVSGFRETWDFDDAATFDAFCEAASATGLGAVVQRIRDGYEDETPRGGRRWIVTYPADVVWSDVTLAQRPGRDGEPKIKTLIEQTTFAVLAPSNGSTHPTGKAYVRRSGDFTTIASYTAAERSALLELARSFDEMPRREAAPSRTASSGSNDGVRPGDDFNRRASWPDLLPDWTHVYERGDTIYLRRPGKDHGISATINHGGADCLYVFSSSTAFDPEKSYTKFGVYATLHHGGDFKRAALALSQQGYADQGSATFKADPAASTTAPGGFTRPAITEGLGEHVLRAKPAQPYSGWFMRGGVHLVAGSSGAGKTTLMLDVLQRQARGELVLGHVGARLDFLVVFADRGKVSNDETLERMRITPGSLSVRHVPPVPHGMQSVAAILAAIEAQEDLPAAVFVEGADLLVEDASKPQTVAPFMGALRQIAERYALAIALSVGAPKAKPHEQYALKRDQVFGSQSWARLANDVLVLSITGDGTVPTRDLVVLHRNAGAETFHLAFADGRLVEAEVPQATETDLITWFQEAETFTARQFRRAFPKLSGARAAQILDGYVALKVLRTKRRGDQTRYVFSRPGRVKPGAPTSPQGVGQTSSERDDSEATAEPAENVPKTGGMGHCSARETDVFPKEIKAQQQDSLIPSFFVLCPTWRLIRCRSGTKDTVPLHPPARARPWWHWWQWRRPPACVGHRGHRAGL